MIKEKDGSMYDISSLQFIVYLWKAYCLKEKVQRQFFKMLS